MAILFLIILDALKTTKVFFRVADIGSQKAVLEITYVKGD